MIKRREVERVRSSSTIPIGTSSIITASIGFPIAHQMRMYSVKRGVSQGSYDRAYRFAAAYVSIVAAEANRNAVNAVDRGEFSFVECLVVLSRLPLRSIDGLYRLFSSTGVRQSFQQKETSLLSAKACDQGGVATELQ